MHKDIVRTHLNLRDVLHGPVMPYVSKEGGHEDATTESQLTSLRRCAINRIMFSVHGLGVGRMTMVAHD